MGGRKCVSPKHSWHGSGPDSESEHEVQGIDTGCYLFALGSIRNHSFPDVELYVQRECWIGFNQYFFNSFCASGAAVINVTIVSLLGGYALARYQFAGKGVMMMLLLLTQMIPGIILVIPLFKVWLQLHLNNTLYSLILTYSTTQLPFCMIMMSGFFSGLLKELEEAAQIDGCTLLGALFRILIPTIAPGIVATGAFALVNSWNDFVYALNFINNQKLFTLPVGLSMMKGEFTIDYGALCAGCIISLIPVLLLFAYIQKYLVKGLAAGAVKG